MEIFGIVLDSFFFSLAFSKSFPTLLVRQCKNVPMLSSEVSPQKILRIFPKILLGGLVLETFLRGEVV